MTAKKGAIATSRPVPAAAPPAVLPLAEYARQRGIARRTAYDRAERGHFDGSGPDRPQAWRDHKRHWWVAPGQYRQPPASDDLERLIDARIAAALERLAAMLRAE